MTPRIAQLLKEGEVVRWRGAPDRALYLAFTRKYYRRVNTAGFVLAVGIGYLVWAEYCTVWRLGAGVAGASVCLAASMIGQRHRLRRTRFLGEYAVTDKRVLCLGMRLVLREAPIDTELRYRIMGHGPSGSVEFRHPRFRAFRFGCLAQRPMSSLLRALPKGCHGVRS